MKQRTTIDGLLERIALSIHEVRLELELSQRRLSKLSGVSTQTIAKVERGGRVDQALLIRLALTIAALQLYGVPASSNDALAEVVGLAGVA